MTAVRRLASDELSKEEVAALRELFGAAWGGNSDEFTDEDWDHALGGLHFILEEGGALVAHASVVERELHTSGHILATGYVEAVATWPIHQRRGHGSALMRDVDEHIDETFQLGALDTGSSAFYERLGWVVWNGPTFVRTNSGLIRTPQEDGNVLVRLTPTSPELDLWAPISCDWRPGDVW
ncbi:MAG TPA: GNAT family N-acetyltransferase [Actinomycetota bacterium]|nr:GNAT family N-acetyltransferase [Actinomycetota bacterium]